MKKALLVLASMALIGFIGLAALPNHDLEARPYQGPALQTGGGDMQTGSYITLGNYPGATGRIMQYGLALVNITAGDVLVGPLDLSYTANMGVSKTTTAGDVTAIGVAYETASYGQPVRFVIRGLTKVKSMVNVTVGVTYGTGGTAGAVSGTSGLTAGTYTSLSRSPIVVISAETRTLGADGLFLGNVNR